MAAFECIDILFYSLTYDNVQMSNLPEWVFECGGVLAACGVFILTYTIASTEISKSGQEVSASQVSIVLGLFAFLAAANWILSPVIGMSSGYLEKQIKLCLVGGIVSCLLTLLQFARTRVSHSSTKLLAVISFFSNSMICLVAIYRDVYKIWMFSLLLIDFNVRVNFISLVRNISKLFSYVSAQVMLNQVQVLPMHDIDPQSEQECSICLEPIKEAVVTKCGHFFDFVCLEMHIKNGTNKKCPYCGQVFELMNFKDADDSFVRTSIGKFSPQNLSDVVNFVQLKTTNFYKAPAKAAFQAH